MIIEAIEFIFSSRESFGGGTIEVGGRELLPLLATHLLVTFQALALACVIAIPPALWLGHTGRARVLAGTIANVGRALPTFAVLALTAAYLGYTTGNLVLAMVLLAVPPIFTNTYVGVRQVAPDVVDAGRGMGLTERQLVLRLELPLAVPLLFAGIRTSTVNVLATATLGPLFGVRTLGEPLLQPAVYGDVGRLGGAILIALLAVGAELIFAALQRAVTPRGLKDHDRPSTRGRIRTMVRMTTVGLLAVAMCFGFVACGDDDDNGGSEGSGASAPAAEAPPAAESKLIQSNPENASTPEVVIGSKNFTEQFIIGEIYVQALEAAGYNVDKQLDLGSEQIAYRAVRAGRISAYPEYTGTALTSFCDVQPADVPKDDSGAYEATRDCVAEEEITALPQTPFTNSNGVGITREKAAELGGITTISELAERASEVTFSGSPECRQRTDCLLGLEDVYDLEFQEYVAVDLSQRHSVLQDGTADASSVFTTDGQIIADDLVLLEDDKTLYPPYNVSLLVRDETVQAAGPDMPRVIAAVQEGLTTEVMQELNSRVDLDKEDPADVARAYLTESGFLAS